MGSSKCHIIAPPPSVTSQFISIQRRLKLICQKRRNATFETVKAMSIGDVLSCNIVLLISDDGSDVAFWRTKPHKKSNLRQVDSWWIRKKRTRDVRFTCTTFLRTTTPRRARSFTRANWRKPIVPFQVSFYYIVTWWGTISAQILIE